MKRLARIIISAVLLVLAFLGAIFFVWPRYQELSMVRSQIREQEERLERGKEALAQLRAMQEKALARQSDFTKLNYALPSELSLPVLYEHIPQIGINSGLSLRSISGSVAEGPVDGMSEFIFQAEFAGSYDGMKNFLDQVRRSARIVNVRALALGANPESPNEMGISVELSAYAIAP